MSLFVPETASFFSIEAVNGAREVRHGRCLRCCGHRVIDPEARSWQVFGCLLSRSKSGSKDERVRRRDSVN